MSSSYFKIMLAALVTLQSGLTLAQSQKNQTRDMNGRSMADQFDFKIFYSGHPQKVVDAQTVFLGVKLLNKARTSDATDAQKELQISYCAKVRYLNGGLLEDSGAPYLGKNSSKGMECESLGVVSIADINELMNMSIEEVRNSKGARALTLMAGAVVFFALGVTGEIMGAGLLTVFQTHLITAGVASMGTMFYTFYTGEKEIAKLAENKTTLSEAEQKALAAAKDLSVKVSIQPWTLAQSFKQLIKEKKSNQN